MVSIFSTAVATLLLINLSMFTSVTLARPLAMERFERQTSPGGQQFSVNTALHFALDVLESTACPAGGKHWLEVAKICEVYQSLTDLEQRLNVVSESTSISNSTSTDIKDLICNKLEEIVTNNRFVISLAADCSDEKLEVVCARAPICWNAMEARSSLQAYPSADQTIRQWINDHIEEEGEIKNFVCRSNQIPC